MNSAGPHVAATGSVSAAFQDFDVWREEFALKIARIDAAVPDRTRFNADIAVQLLPRLFLSRYRTGPLDLIRTRQLLKDGDNGCSVVICVEGTVVARFGEQELVINPGEAVLVPHHRMGTLSTRVNATTIALRFDRETALTLAPSLDELTLRKAVAGHQAVQLMKAYGEQILSSPDGLASPFASLASAQLRELAAHVLNPNSDIARGAQYGGVKAARLSAVLNAMSANFREPGLSAAMVGASLGLTERYVHQLMEGVGMSFSQHVRRLRLDEARRLLRERDTRHLRITDIALAVGFQDISYFNREFRRAYAEKPSDARKST
jgi:AraC-like DNA-binding protein